MAPVSSAAMSTFWRMMSSARADCVFGVSRSAAIDMAARTSGGKLADVWTTSSRRLAARNSIIASANAYLSKAPRGPCYWVCDLAMEGSFVFAGDGRFGAVREEKGQAKAQCHLVFEGVCNILISLGRPSESARRLASHVISSAIWRAVRKAPINDPIFAEKHKCQRMFRLESGFEN